MAQRLSPSRVPAGLRTAADSTRRSANARGDDPSLQLQERHGDGARDARRHYDERLLILLQLPRSMLHEPCALVARQIVRHGEKS